MKKTSALLLACLFLATTGSGCSALASDAKPGARTFDELNADIETIRDERWPLAYRVSSDSPVPLYQNPYPGEDEEPLQYLVSGDQVEFVSFYGCYAHVRTDAAEGYTLAGNLVETDGDSYLGELRITTVVEKYTYDILQKDLAALCAAYPDSCSQTSLGKSVGGRDLSCLVLGDPEAKRHVLVQASMHAREFMTAMLAVAQAETLLGEGIPEDFCFYIVPMINPDGVTIAQGLDLGPTVQAIYESDVDKGYTSDPIEDYVLQWKANGRGVDLNHNFDANWETIDRVSAFSFEGYRGEAPMSEPESQALAALAESREWDATVSYHAYGSVLYWAFSDCKANASGLSIARAVQQSTGYLLMPNTGSDAGGFKDWVQKRYAIPSVTIEIGTQPCPIPLSEFANIYIRNRDVLVSVAEWIKNQ